MNRHHTETSPTRLWAVKMAILFLSVVSLPVWVTAGERVAFVVGIGTYDKLPDYDQLKNAVNDATAVSEKLAAIGFKVIREVNPDLSTFKRKWNNTLDRLNKEDTFVLFFSGHGVQIEGQNYLLTRDTPYKEYGRQEKLIQDAISLNVLLGDLTMGDRPHPKHSVIILDACRDNPFTPSGYKSLNAGPSGLAEVPSSEGMFVMYAAASSRTALDRLGSDDPVKNSVFTRALLPLLERQDLSIQELSTRLKDEVWTLAKKAGKEQLPAYYDGIFGRFCLPGCGGSEVHAKVHPSQPPNLSRPPTPTSSQFEMQNGRVYSHPQDHSIALYFNGFEFRITLPKSQTPRVRFVTELREGEWMPLFGSDIPISVMRTGNRFLAKWEPWVPISP